MTEYFDSWLSLLQQLHANTELVSVELSFLGKIKSEMMKGLASQHFIQPVNI